MPPVRIAGRSADSLPLESPDNATAIASLAGMLPPACRRNHPATRASTSRWSAQPCNAGARNEAFAIGENRATPGSQWDSVLLSPFPSCYYAEKAAVFSVEGSQLRGYLGGMTIDSLDTFALLSELAIAMMGFAGVAAAFAGRERTYAPVEEQRLRGLFQMGGIVLVGSLAVPSLSGAGMANSAIFRIVGLAMAVCVLALAIAEMPRNVRAMRDPETTTEAWIPGINAAMLSVTVLLFATDALWIGEAWPLLSGFSLLLIHGVWIFFRLLTRRN